MRRGTKKAGTEGISEKERVGELHAAIMMICEEKKISPDILYDAIENSLRTACKNHFGKEDNIGVEINRETSEYRVYAEKTVVGSPEEVEDPMLQITQDEAVQLHLTSEIGAVVQVDINSRDFGRIATANAKNIITQKIREEEKNAVINYFSEMKNTAVTGIVGRRLGRNLSINLGRADGILPDKEQIPGEVLEADDHVKVYIMEVQNNSRGPRILVSRRCKELVQSLFETEVAEIQQGIVTIESIAREPGSRTKIAVWSNDPDVDAVGACVGLNGSRVNAIVRELSKDGREKIDIVNWDENPGELIKNALSPAKITAVFADPEERSAKVVVPDYQLSLAIGKEGQNARLAAKLTGYRIDIKNETQAKDAVGFRYEDYLDYDEYDGEEYEEEYEEGAYEEDYEEAPVEESQEEPAEYDAGSMEE